jgi:hypothetical protein
MTNAIRIGQPGGENFPYWIETPSEQFISYAPTMLEALRNFYDVRLGHEPMLVRQMSDGE